MKTVIFVFYFWLVGSAIGREPTATYVVDKTISVPLKAGQTEFIPASDQQGTLKAPQSPEGIFILPKSGDIQVFDGFYYGEKQHWGLAAVLSRGHSFIRSSNGRDEKITAITDATVDLVYWRLVVK